MKPAAEVQKQIDDVGDALAQALGEAAECIAVYGSAAGDDFSQRHSDVNLVIVLRDVTFEDLRLIGATLTREAPEDLLFATPLVVVPQFLKDARDSFPIELADMAERHRILHGRDLLADLRVGRAHVREEAEREARSKLLHLRALVMHRPPDGEMRHALSALVSTIALIERALLGSDHRTSALKGSALFAEIEKRQGIRLTTLARLHGMREGTEAWPEGEALDDLIRDTLRDVEALVAWVDAHAHDPEPTRS